MKKIVFLLFSFSLSVFSSVEASEKATIQQMKGKKAILLFKNDIPFSVGQVVFITSAEGEELGLSKENRNLLQRKNSISLTGKFSNLSQDGEKSTELSLSLRYSWNWSNFEFGPDITISNTDANDVTTATTGFGGYVDYNLSENVPGQDFVWGLTARALMGNVTEKSDLGTNRSNSTILDAGVQAKFFKLSQVLALRTELVYEVQKVKDQKDTTGFIFNIGLQNYF